jgi:hypothetical protein
VADFRICRPRDDFHLFLYRLLTRRGALLQTRVTAGARTVGLVGRHIVQLCLGHGRSGLASREARERLGAAAGAVFDLFGRVALHRRPRAT